jgi:hypothetical protein
MAGRLRQRARTLLPAMLFAQVLLGMQGGSHRAPGRRDTRPAKRRCEWPGCNGVMKPRGDYYVCNKDSSHKVRRDRA